jgi:hypothetical protein
MVIGGDLVRTKNGFYQSLDGFYLHGIILESMEKKGVFLFVFWNILARLGCSQ